MKLSLILVAALAGIAPAFPAAAADPTPASATAETMVLDRNVFEKDTTIDADVITFKSGANVTINNGATVVLRSRVLRVEGPAFVNGRGTPGAPGGNGANNERTWTSTNHCWNNQGHDDWVASGHHPNDRGGNGGNGGNGGPGGRLDVHYITLAGVTGGLANITADMKGGAAGPGGAPGLGAHLICGCHGEHKRGDSGSRGADGTPGTDGGFTFTQDR